MAKKQKVTQVSAGSSSNSITSATATPFGTPGTPNQGIIVGLVDPGPVPEFTIPSLNDPPPPMGSVFSSPEERAAIAAYQRLVRADTIYRQAIVLFFKKLHEYKQNSFWGKNPEKPSFVKSFTDAFMLSLETDKDSLPYSIFEIRYANIIAEYDKKAIDFASLCRQKPS